MALPNAPRSHGTVSNTTASAAISAMQRKMIFIRFCLIPLPHPCRDSAHSPVYFSL